MKYSGHRKLLCELAKCSKFNAFILLGYQTNTDASILVYKFRPERTGVNMYATAINFPRIITLGNPVFKAKYFFAKKLFSYPKVMIMRKSVTQEEYGKNLKVLKQVE